MRPSFSAAHVFLSSPPSPSFYKGCFGFFHGVSFALQFASDTGAIYMSPVWGPRVSISFQVRPRRQCRGFPLPHPRSSLRTFTEMDTSPQQMSAMLIHSSIHSNIYTKVGFGPGTMLDQVRYRDEVDTGLVHGAREFSREVKLCA